MNDHDQRLKTLIRVFFVEFLELFFADWLDLIDLTEIIWLEQEITPEPPDGKRYVVDLVAQVRSREAIPPWHSKEREPFALAILIEIEAPDRSTSIRERIPRYTRNLKQKLQMPVLPITLFLNLSLEGIGKLHYEERIRDLITDYSESLYVGLPYFDALQYVKGSNWLGVALSALMRIPSEQVVSLGAEALRRLAGSPLSDQKKFLLGECVEAYLPLDDQQTAELEGLLETKTYSEVKALNLTTFDKGMMKGMIKGRVEGEEIGIQKALLRGLIDGLLLAVEFKFGQVEDGITEAVKSLKSIDEVQRVKESLKAAKTPEEFLNAVSQG